MACKLEKVVSLGAMLLLKRKGHMLGAKGLKCAHFNDNLAAGPYIFLLTLQDHHFLSFTFFFRMMFVKFGLMKQTDHFQMDTSGEQTVQTSGLLL